ncbi:hypothetical protein B0T24DRAFT_699919 [Lasiosphaeria ovina]|uniref:NAD(P)-binding protein n=1 Tax=Lasiosphaeria ovina TaxID=92902 RepID=A0AAE0NAR9_9PEZI|nr:hypothetical protein B0T24DRAFT_699919 [Lasiosphaeria ovina]
MTFSSTWTQFPPCGPLTEANLPNQAGKVVIVTGGSSGLGFELSRILYGAGAKLYILTRSKEHANDAVSRITALYSKRDGQQDGMRQIGSLEYIYMDLADLATVKAATAANGGRLDVLFYNAGTDAVKKATLTARGHEFLFGVNGLGGFLLARLLQPVLAQTAARPGTAADTLANAVAGRYAIPDGRWHPGGMRDDLLGALRSADEGGSGRAAEYYDRCEERVREFL